MSTPSQKPRPSRPDTEPGKRKQPAVSPWPFFWCGLSVLLYVFHPHLHTLLPGVELEHLHNVAAVSLFYSFGWLMAHSFRAFVTRKIYQASVDVTLRLRVPVEQAKQLLKEAAARAQETTGMVETQKAMVRVSSYGVEGITYTVKYWVSNYAHDLECRDAMLAAIDATLRKHDALPLVEPVRLMLGKDKIVRGVSQETT